VTGGELLLALGAVGLVAGGRSNADDNTDAPDTMTLIGLSPVTPHIHRFALAIATAEGYYVANSIPRRANNPGNLIIPGWTGPKIGSEGNSVFPSVEEGWRRLYKQLALIRDGRSRVYNVNMTIAQMGNKWAPGGAANIPGAWAQNVARMLEVQPTTQLRFLLS
jgi:hypothetical protein